MRYVREATANVIEQALEAQITALQPLQHRSLMVANKIRLIKLALQELTKNKYIKNGKTYSKQG